MAILAMLMWLRLFAMLQLTKLFGPTLRIIFVMLKELGIFMALWVMQLIMFATMGCLLFGKLAAYKSYY